MEKIQQMSLKINKNSFLLDKRGTESNYALTHLLYLYDSDIKKDNRWFYLLFIWKKVVYKLFFVDFKDWICFNLIIVTLFLIFHHHGTSGKLPLP